MRLADLLFAPVRLMRRLVLRRKEELAASRCPRCGRGKLVGERWCNDCLEDRFDLL